MKETQDHCATIHGGVHDDGCRFAPNARPARECGEM